MRSETTPTISIVVPTHQRRDRLPSLLDAIAPQPASEVIVVVNASRDGSLDLLEARAAREPRLRPMFVAEPGQTRALQAGVEAASGEVVLMLDDDVLPEAGLVEGHARHHAVADGLVVVGYMPVALPRPRRCGQFPAFLYADDYERACDAYERDPASILTALWAGNVSIRRADCLEVRLRPGPEMPDGYGYHEDRDFGLRCREAGMRGAFDRRLRARHMYEKSPRAFLRAARNSGETRVAVHRAHAEAIGPLADDTFVRAVSPPERPLVVWAGRGARRPIQLALRAIAALAGALHIFRAESHAGYIMGTIEQQHGAIEAGGPATRGRR